MLKPPPLPDDEFPHRFACTFFGMRILFSIVDHAIMKSTSRMLSSDIECTAMSENTPVPEAALITRALLPHSDDLCLPPPAGAAPSAAALFLANAVSRAQLKSKSAGPLSTTSPGSVSHSQFFFLMPIRASSMP
jgi:hypothetical protein